VLVVELGDADVGTGLEIASGEGSHLLSADLVNRYAAPTPEGATPLLITDVHIPKPSTVTPRVNERLAKPLTDDCVIAGGPDGTPLPINFVGQKLTASYLSTNGPLAGDDFLCGHLREFETFWEPLGWALDEWIETLSLAPFEDTVQSGIDLSSDGRRQTNDASRTRIEDFGETVTDSSATEAMRTAMSADVSSRGRSGSIGGPAKGVAAPANPVLALVHGLTGAFQFGFENASSSMRGGLQGDLRTDVVSRLQQGTSQQRATNNESLASVVSAWRESRRLRAIRNLGEGSSENLAVFSVVRQWLVSTVEAPPKAVVLIKAHELEKPFDQADLFTHRAALAQGLLDPDLAQALTSSAKVYRPATQEAPAASQARIMAERATGKLVVGDPARGRGSKIRITVLFSTDGADQSFNQVMPAPREESLLFDIKLEGELRKVAGWRFEFINPGLKGDNRASITPVDVTIHAGGEPVKVEIPGPIVLAPGDPRTFPRGFETQTPGSASEKSAGDKPSGDLQRLLHHLDANRPYYRLLIDLYTDPITRFVRLVGRQPRPPIPADLQPVGVAGAHLAFLTGDPVTSPRDDAPPIKTVLSTPAGGTFVEVLEGRTKMTATTPTDGWPRVALEPESTLPWPAPMEIPPVDGVEDHATAEPTKPPEPPAVPEAQLPKKLADILASLETLKSAVDGLKPPDPTATADADAAADADDEAKAT